MAISDRDLSMRRHLYTRVLGLELSTEWQRQHFAQWNPLEGPNAGNSALELWAKAQEMGLLLEVRWTESTPYAKVWQRRANDMSSPHLCLKSAAVSDTVPRVISEAVAKATGWEEPK